MIWILASKFWIEAAFMLAFYVNSETFQPLLVSFTFSMWTFIAKSFAILSPQVAEMKRPIPLIVYCTFSGMSALLALMLRLPKKL